MKTKDIAHESLLSDEEFKNIRKDQDAHVRDFHLKEFKGRLELLLREAYEEAYNIGGNAVGPGIQRDLYKIAKVSVLNILGNQGR